MAKKGILDKTDEAEDMANQESASTLELLRFLVQQDSPHAKQIIKVIEDDARHKRQQESRGQIFSFILGIGGLGVSAFLAARGLGAGSIFPALGGVSPVIIALFLNSRKK